MKAIIRAALVFVCIGATSGCAPIVISSAISSSKDNKQRRQLGTAQEQMLLGGNFTPLTDGDVATVAENAFTAAKFEARQCPVPEPRAWCAMVLPRQVEPYPAEPVIPFVGPEMDRALAAGERPTQLIRGLREWDRGAPKFATWVIDGRQLARLDVLESKRAGKLIRLSFPVGDGAGAVAK